MGELYDIFLTSAVTIIGGISIFVIGQIILKFFIEPVNDLRGVIGETVYALIFYSNIYTNPSITTAVERRIEVSNTLREKASLLNSKVCMIKWYGLFKFLKLIPDRDSIVNASVN